MTCSWPAARKEPAGDGETLPGRLLANPPQARGYRHASAAVPAPGNVPASDMPERRPKGVPRGRREPRSPGASGPPNPTKASRLGLAAAYAFAAPRRDRAEGNLRPGGLNGAKRS
jgi:hypothetical protein